MRITLDMSMTERIYQQCKSLEITRSIGRHNNCNLQYYKKESH